MRARAHREDGFTLVELLVAMLLSLVVLGATTNAFLAFGRQTDSSTRLNDAQDRARTTVSLLAKQLRNLASPTPAQPMAIDLAAPSDLVFQTVDPVGPNTGANKVNVRRLRYCLGTADPSRLYLQSQRWTTATTPPVPSTSACPGDGWTSTREVVSAVTNRHGGQARPLFSYNATQNTSITRIATELWVDPQPARAPKEVSLATAVGLRNQNRAPTASFTITDTSGGSAVILNGSQSEDPENQTLQFVWWSTSSGVRRKLSCEGVVCSTPVSSGTHLFELTVSDPAGLTGTVTQAKSVP